MGGQDLTFSFEAPIWTAAATGAWHFVSLPHALSDEIADAVPRGPGFGSVRVTARIGESLWATSIFPDSRLSTYVLPVKRAIRDREQAVAGDVVRVELTVAPAR